MKLKKLSIKKKKTRVNRVNLPYQKRRLEIEITIEKVATNHEAQSPKKQILKDEIRKKT
jgi:hypothetical protein